jgi:hypothetical protein
VSVDSAVLDVLSPDRAMNGPGLCSGPLVVAVTRINTTGAMQLPGNVIVSDILALPAELSGKEPVVAATLPPLPPQTRLAATPVTGPTPIAGIIRPLILDLTRPSEEMVIDALVTTQGAPPLLTPPMV